jgi:hypothetical protein
MAYGRAGKILMARNRILGPRWPLSAYPALRPLILLRNLTTAGRDASRLRTGLDEPGSAR